MEYGELLRTNVGKYGPEKTPYLDTSRSEHPWGANVLK